MRIGIDARFYGPKGKGLGRYTQKLIENLEKIDSENEYMIFLRKENWNEYEPAAPNFNKVLSDYRWYTLAEQIFMPVKIHQTRVDLMHFPHFNVPIFYFGNFVVTIHDLILRHFKTSRASTLGILSYQLKHWAYRIIIWLAIKRAKKIITVSNFVKDDITGVFKIKTEKISVTYEGSPADNLSPSILKKLRQSKQLLKKYGIIRPYLLYVGNAYPHKNLERLAEAFKILIHDKNYDIQLVLIGELDFFYQRLKKQISFWLEDSEIISRFIFTDFIRDDELDVLYANALVYIFPSQCEGFGLPPLEAMAHGVPVVSSKSTCLPEILGEAAVYFDAINPQDMAEKINKILSEESSRQKLIAAGYEQIKKYSWKKMAEETLKIYS